MKKYCGFSLVISLCLIGLIAFSACEKNSGNSNHDDHSTNNNNGSDGCDEECFIAYMNSTISCNEQFKTCANQCGSDYSCIEQCLDSEYDEFYLCADACGGCIGDFYYCIDTCGQIEVDQDAFTCSETCIDTLIPCLNWDDACFDSCENVYQVCNAGCGIDVICYSDCLIDYCECEKGCT